MLCSFSAYSQTTNTPIIGTTIKLSAYRLAADAGRMNDFKSGEKIFIYGVEKQYFKSKDSLGRKILILQSDFFRPDSLIKFFAKEIEIAEKIEKEKEDAIKAKEKEAIENIKEYLEKNGSIIDRYCFEFQDIRIGMSKFVFKLVKKEKPLSINYTKTEYGTDEQWVYPNYVYYYFYNDKLKVIQEQDNR